MRSIYLILVFITLQTNGVHSKTLTYVVGLSKPPYVQEEKETGYELEMIRAISKKMGFEAAFIYVPFGRSPLMMNVDEVDGILTVNQQIIDQPQHLTHSYITYQNVVITKRSENLTISTIEDLARVSIAAFQNSTKLLGDAYAHTVKQSPYFTELPDQSKQLLLLNENRVQALVMDINIFYHYASQGKGFVPQDYSVHFVFPPSDYAVAFTDTANVTRFNQILADFNNSEQHLSLKKKYQIQAFKH